VKGHHYQNLQDTASSQHTSILHTREHGNILYSTAVQHDIQATWSSSRASGNTVHRRLQTGQNHRAERPVIEQRRAAKAPHSPGMRVGAVPATDLQELMCLFPSTMAVSTVQQTSSCFVQPGCQCKPPPVTPRSYMHVACAGSASSRATNFK
jgi:hypothetical protein